MERGKVEVRAGILLRISREFVKTIGWLLTGEEQPVPARRDHGQQHRFPHRVELTARDVRAGYFPRSSPPRQFLLHFLIETDPSAVSEPCAARLHNRTPAHPSSQLSPRPWGASHTAKCSLDSKQQLNIFDDHARI